MAKRGGPNRSMQVAWLTLLLLAIVVCAFTCEFNTAPRIIVPPAPAGRGAK